MDDEFLNDTETEDYDLQDWEAEPSVPFFDRAVVDSVPVLLEAVIGEKTLTIAELMDLQSGSVVQLASSLGQMAELKLNGNTVARGELVAVGDQFGVRISEICN